MKELFANAIDDEQSIVDFDLEAYAETLPEPDLSTAINYSNEDAEVELAELKAGMYLCMETLTSLEGLAMKMVESKDGDVYTLESDPLLHFTMDAIARPISLEIAEEDYTLEGIGAAIKKVWRGMAKMVNKFFDKIGDILMSRSESFKTNRKKLYEIEDKIKDGYVAKEGDLKVGKAIVNACSGPTAGTMATPKDVNDFAVAFMLSDASIDLTIGNFLMRKVAETLVKMAPGATAAVTSAYEKVISIEFIVGWLTKSFLFAGVKKLTPIRQKDGMVERKVFESKKVGFGVNRPSIIVNLKDNRAVSYEVTQTSNVLEPTDADSFPAFKSTKEVSKLLKALFAINKSFGNFTVHAAAFESRKDDVAALLEDIDASLDVKVSKDKLTDTERNKISAGVRRMYALTYMDIDIWLAYHGIARTFALSAAELLDRAIEEPKN